jgi:hypothetical protein
MNDSAIFARKMVDHLRKVIGLNFLWKNGFGI